MNPKSKCNNMRVAQGPGDGVAGALNAGGKEDAEFAGEQRVRQRPARSWLAQPQQVRRYAHIICPRLPARLHLANTSACLSQ